MSLIHIKDLTKHFKILNRREGLSGAFRDLFSGNYRTVEAVAGISFDIEAGEIVGYIGPNGAGKSTTIKMMTGILKPTGGMLQVNGLMPYDNRIRQAQIMWSSVKHAAVVGLPVINLQDPERDLQGRSKDVRPSHGHVQRTGRAQGALLTTGADVVARAADALRYQRLVPA
jgi:ABC-type oligopeptide transport system ATPase subunit